MQCRHHIPLSPPSLSENAYNPWRDRYETSKKEKEDHLVQLIVGAVPSLDRYRPRLFSNVKEICAALSSHALPKLKWRFQKNSEGLLIQGESVRKRAPFVTHTD